MLPLENLKITITYDPGKFPVCARMMTATDPWITLKMDFEQCLKAFEGSCKEICIAESGNEIVGYLCGTSCRYGTQFPILQTMIGRLNELVMEGNRLTEENTFIYGPVCIAKSARGSGILNGLYQALKKIASLHYSFCILFISDKNPRSINAHLKLGMNRLGVFEFNNGLFHIMGASLNR